METLEFIHSEARKARESLEAAQDHLAKIQNIPRGQLRADLCLALRAAGVPSDPAAVGAKVGTIDWSLSGARDGLNKAGAEFEVLESIADDLIGTSGRLV